VETDCRFLISELEDAAGDVEKYDQIIRATKLDINSVSRYCNFSSKFYCRNLIHKDANFELMLVCWDEGQFSPLHDHNGQHGWMLIMQGCLLEELYGSPQDILNGDVVVSKTRKLNLGDISYITDDIACHKISNAVPSRSVSLHLYSKPVASCHRYDPRSGEFKMQQMSYYETS
jgi:cysteine dioxygenase